MAGNKGDTFQNDVLLLFLENADIATIGDAGGILGSVVAGSVYISLHTADPSAGTQTTSEASYTGYARVAVTRTAGAWTTASGATENTSDIDFAECTGGSDTITHVGIGAASALGAGLLIYVGTCSLAVSSGITPKIAAGNLDITEA